MALCVRDNDATISSGARVTRRTILGDGAGALVSSDSVDSESARDANSCAPHVVNESLDKCLHIQKYECNADTDSAITNYLYFHHCTMKKYQSLSVVALIGVVILSFYVLGDTAEEFFCRLVIKVAKVLQLSPNTAGVTLLALGNGAPDVLLL